MRVAICDDNEMSRELLNEFLGCYFANRAIHYQVVQYETAVPLLCDVEEGELYDLIFLDIYMEEILGIEAAYRLRGIGYRGEIAFLTATDEFALAGYEVGAAGYLLKPLAYEKFCHVMERMTKHLQESTYSIKQRSAVIRIPYGEIIYIESINSKCILHTKNKEYVLYKQLDKIEQELKDCRFLRCHQSFLVNMDYIIQADKEFELENGETVMIRQRDVKTIRQTFIDYMKSKIDQS